MPLLSFWKNNRDEVLKLTIEQVVSSAGDGNLRDNSPCSQEFREFLRFVPIEALCRYAQYCLDNALDRGGLVLQDIMNEFGQRLDFDVEHGLYQGKKTAVGFDGIWRAKNEPELIIEVKTTDYVTVSLDKLANYRSRLVEEKRVAPASKVLIVVGREDTGALEAQVRGSRYAWDMRLISIDGLMKLVQIKEKSDDENTLRQIRTLLQPFEYTKVDQIIDVIFSTARDVEVQQTAEEAIAESKSEKRTFEWTDREVLNAKRLSAVEAFGKLKGAEFVKKSTTLFWTTDKKTRVCCAVSKRYGTTHQGYWYAYHPQWDEFLKEGEESYLLLACMDMEDAFALPYKWITTQKQFLDMTDRGDRSYWHIRFARLDDGALAIILAKKKEKVPLVKYRYSLTGKADRRTAK
ncbi:MAG: hypothetical protein ABIU05_19775 [Nitrospirales bacterium]